MMPTFPSSSLEFRTAGFPPYGFKAGISGVAFPLPWFAIALRAHWVRPVSLVDLPVALVRAEPRERVPTHIRHTASAGSRLTATAD